MEITWFGHSCFLIKNKSGKKFLTDPFCESLGYNLPNEIVDIVTISHHHFDHDNTSNLLGTPKIIDDCTQYEDENIYIKGFPSYHDILHGQKRGANTIFLYKLDGYTLCHLGDLGHSLSDEFIDLLGKIDILFIPVGGNYTIDGKDAAIITKKINPHIIIPMHYKTPKLSFPLDGVEIFVSSMKKGEKINSCTFNVDTLPTDFNNVVILEYKQY